MPGKLMLSHLSPFLCVEMVLPNWRLTFFHAIGQQKIRPLSSENSPDETQVPCTWWNALAHVAEAVLICIRDSRLQPSRQLATAKDTTCVLTFIVTVRWNPWPSVGMSILVPCWSFEEHVMITWNERWLELEASTYSGHISALMFCAFRGSIPLTFILTICKRSQTSTTSRILSQSFVETNVLFWQMHYCDWLVSVLLVLCHY